MKFSELIECSIEIIKAFNPVVKTLDAHSDDFLVKVSDLCLTLNLCLV